MAYLTARKVLLAAGGFVAGVTLALLVFREPMEPLSASALQAARERWATGAFRNYDIDYSMNNSPYEVQVRDGVVVRAMANGQPPTSVDWQLYSVEGLFDTLQQELDNNSVSDSAATPAGPVVMRVRFDPKLGYPERYLRTSSGAMRGAAIEVTRFERK